MKTATAIVIALGLSACGSGTFPNGSVVNSPGGGPTQPPTRLVNVTVTVTIPARTKERARPGYVSVNTASLVIELASVDGQGVTGINPTTIETSAHARGCTAQAHGRVCSAIASGSPGEDVFAVTTYGGADATGAVLSVGSVRAKIGGNAGGVQISNTLSLALDGVIAGLKLSLWPTSGKRGTPMKSSVTLAAYDATGAQIVGPSAFTTPIGLAIEGDAGHAFVLHAGAKSGTALSIVKPPGAIALSYDGDKQASSISLAATVDGPGSIGKSAGFTLRGKEPPPPVGTIYALNLGSADGRGATVTEYGGKANGNAAPARTLQLSSKLYARGIAVDASGNLYVGYFDNADGFSPSDGAPDKGNEIAVYAPDAGGNDQPAGVIAADKSSHTALFPIFMSFDGSGDLVTYGATDVDGNEGNDAVLMYASPASVPQVPANAWAFVSPTLIYAGPTGLALDASGNFYVNGALHTSLGPDPGLFVAPASEYDNPAVNPSRTVPWNGTTELAPGFTRNVTLSESGEIYIANAEEEGSGSYPACQGRANVFAAGSTGGSTDVPPLRVLTLDTVYTSNSQCVSPSNSLAPFFPTITLFGTTLFVADDFNNAIDAFSSGGNGTVKPSRRIVGSSTGLNAPAAVFVTAVSGQAKARPAHPL